MAAVISGRRLLGGIALGLVVWLAPAAAALAADPGDPNGTVTKTQPGPDGSSQLSASHTLTGPQVRPGSVPDGHGYSSSNLNYGIGSTPSGGGVGGGGPCVDGPLTMPSYKTDLPALSIQTGPRVQGVVGVTTFFWVDGKTGSFNGHWQTTVQAGYQHRANPMYSPPPDPPRFLGCATDVWVPVWVTLYYWPIQYTWDWGDGAPQQTVACTDISNVGGCNFGFDAPSQQLTHTYESSSVSEVDHGGFPVLVTIRFAIGMQVGEAARTIFMDTVDEPVWLRYPVREVESLLTG